MRNNYFRDIANLYQNGSAVESKPKKRIFIARQYEEGDRERDTFLKEAQAAGELSAAEGVPFEIITVQSEEDWQNRVRPLIEKFKGQGVQWGVFGHTKNYGANMETVDDIMSNADEVFLGSCSGLYCANSMPKTKEQSRLITNSGAIFTGVPRFKDYKGQVERVKKSNPKESAFLSLLYGNTPGNKYGGPGRVGVDYLDWKSFNKNNLTEEDKTRLARLRALSEIRHEAFLNNEERPTQLPPDFVMTDLQRSRLLDSLGLLSPEERAQFREQYENYYRQQNDIIRQNQIQFRLDRINRVNSTFPRDTTFDDLTSIFSLPEDSSYFDVDMVNELENELTNLSEEDFVDRYGVPVDVTRRFIDQAKSILAERERYSDSVNIIPSRGQTDTWNMYRNAMRPPQLSGVQNRKIGGIVLRK